MLLPLLYSFNSIPPVVLYPLFLLFLGIGELSRGGFAFLSGVLLIAVLALVPTLLLWWIEGRVRRRYGG